MALALERWNQNLATGCVFLVYAACGLLLCTVPIYGVVAVAITVYGAAHGFLNGGNFFCLKELSCQEGTYWSRKGRQQNSKDVVTNLPLKLVTNSYCESSHMRYHYSCDSSQLKIGTSW